MTDPDLARDPQSRAGWRRPEPRLLWIPPLRFTIPVLLAVFFLVLLAVTAVLMIRSQNRLLEREFQDEVELLSQLTVGQIEAHFRTGHPELSRRAVEQLNSDRNLRFAILIDAQGEVIESTDRDLKRRPYASVVPSEARALVRQARYSFGSQTRFAHGRKTLLSAQAVAPPLLGTPSVDAKELVLLMSHDVSRMQNRSRTETLLAGASAGTPLLVLLVLIGLIIRVLVYDRLQFLAWQFGRITAQGGPSGEPLTGPDEFSHFSRSMEILAEKLQRRTEDLRQSEERFSLAMRGANDGLWDWNLVTNDVYLSPRWKGMLGYRDDELENSLDTWRRLLHPDDRAETQRMVQKYVEGTRSGFHIEFRLRTKEGSYRTILSRAFPMTQNGKPIRLVGTHVDLTERKRAEEQIRELNRNLEQRVEHRTAQLRLANEELESFAHTVSHDLRAPLRSIKGFTTALEEDFGKDLPEGARDSFYRIRNAAQRMGNIIEGMLTLSRISKGQTHFAKVDLSSLAEEIVRELRHLDPGRAVVVEIDPGMRVWGDKRLLQSLLWNLLENSWKYTSESPDAWISFRQLREENGEEGNFCVKDNGAGFEASDPDLTFQPFHRFHTQSEFSGEGIGLATVKRIIARHGGRVWAESGRGQGTAVSFTLPLQPHPVGSAA